MNITMTVAEQSLLQSFLSCTTHYLEFGVGGSTVLACQRVSGSVTAVESDPVWLTQVRQACADLLIQPTLLHVDIGPVTTWGYPREFQQHKNWPDYHTGIWQRLSIKADLCLIDGRFRVATAIQALNHLPNSIILVHDFAVRCSPPFNYHIILKYAREIARAENLSAFVRRDDWDEASALTDVATFSYEPR